MTTHRSSKQAAEIYILKTINTRRFGLLLLTTAWKAIIIISVT